MGISDKKFFEVNQGEDKDIQVNLLEDDEVVDLTAATEITARFVKGDGSLLEKKFSDDEIEVVSVAGGKIKIILAEADTALLLVGDKQAFEVEALVDGVTTIVRFDRALTVKAPIA